MKPEPRRPILQPRRPILAPRRSATPATATNSPVELVHRLETLDQQRQDLIRRIVVSIVKESLTDSTLVERLDLVDYIMTKVAKLPELACDSLPPFVASIVDFYLLERAVSQ